MFYIHIVHVMWRWGLYFDGEKEGAGKSAGGAIGAPWGLGGSVAEQECSHET